MGSKPPPPDSPLPRDEFDDLLRAAFESPGSQSDGASVLARIEQRSGKLQRVLLRDIGDDSAPPIRPKSAEVGGQAGRYAVLGEVARGGVGSVLKVRDVDLGRDVAMKVLLDKHRDKESLVDRFVEEAQVGGQLQHPGILPVYELGLLPDQRPYFTMKLIKGKTLGALLKERSSAEENRLSLVASFEKVCEAMAYAHARGVVHRDLKPANILVGSYGELKVIDWGFAKVLPRGGVADEPREESTEHISEVSIIETVRSGSDGSQSIAGSVMGTPAYMSPEQAMGRIDRLDERSDVFSLGAILCEILTGKPPYTGTNEDIIVKALQANLTDAFDRLDRCGADKPLVAIAKRCLRAARAERPANAGKLAQRVHAYRLAVEDRARQSEIAMVEAKGRAEAEHLRAESNRRLAEEETRRRRLGHVFAAAVAAFAIAVAVGGVWWHNKSAARVRERSAQLSASLEQAREAIGAAQAQAKPDLALWEKAVTAAASASAFAEGGDVEPDLAKSAASAVELARRLRNEAAEVDVRLQQDEWMRTELEALRFGSGDPFAGDSDDEAYEKLFRRYGIDLETGEPDLLAKQIADTAIAAELAAAIDDWAFVRARTRREGTRPAADLARIATQADDDPHRRALREAVAQGSVGRLAGFATGDQSAFNETAYHLLGLGLGRAGDVPAAVAALEQGIRRFPGDARLRFDLGYWLTELPNPRWREAIEQYAIVLSSHPNSLAARNNLGAALIEVDEFDRAIAHLEQVAAQKKGYARGLLNVGIARQRAGHDDALAWIDKAIRADREYALARFQKGAILEERGEHREAQEAYRKTWELDPTHEQACTKLVEFHIQRFELSEARKLAATAVEKNEGAAWPLHLRGYVAGARDDFVTAIADIEQSIAIDDKRGQAYGDLGAAYFQMGDYAKAKEAYSRAVELDPENRSLIFDLASTHELLGDFAAHRRLLERGAAPPHPHSGCIGDLASIRLREGDVAGAIALAKEAVRADPESLAASSHLANTLGYAMDPAEALAEYDALAAQLENPCRSGALSGIAWWLSARDEHERALELVVEALREAPDEYGLYRTIGSYAGYVSGSEGVERLAAQFAEAGHSPRAVAMTVESAADSIRKRGGNEDAIRCFELALEYFPEAYLSFRGAANAHLALGNKEECLKAHERCLAICGKDSISLHHWGWALGYFGASGEEAIDAYESRNLGDNAYLEARFLCGVARGLASAKHWEEGIAVARRAIRTLDSWAPVHATLAVVLASAERFQEASQALAQGLRLSPGRTDWSAEMGRYLGAVHSPATARERYRELVGRPPPAIGRDFEKGLMGAYSTRWRHADVRQLLETVQLDPALAADVANQRAVLLCREGDLPAAERLLEKAMRRYASEENVLANLALVQVRKKDYRRAEELYERAAFYSADPEGYAGSLAVCALARRDWPRALRHLEDASDDVAARLRPVAEEGRELASGGRLERILEGKIARAESAEQAFRWAALAYCLDAPDAAEKYFRQALPADGDGVGASEWNLRLAAAASLDAARRQADSPRAERAFKSALAWADRYFRYLEERLQKEEWTVSFKQAVRGALANYRVLDCGDWIQIEERIDEFPEKQREGWRKLRERVLALAERMTDFS